jgi:hypothetical protein
MLQRNFRVPINAKRSAPEASDNNEKEKRLGERTEVYDPNNETKHRCLRIPASHSIYGGAERDRTADLLVANEALSQLSYSPPPNARRTPLLQAQRRQTTSPSVPASATRLKHHPRPASLRKSTDTSPHHRPCGQGFLHHMPHLILIHHHTKHWHN